MVTKPRPQKKTHDSDVSKFICTSDSTVVKDTGCGAEPNGEKCKKSKIQKTQICTHTVHVCLNILLTLEQLRRQI